MQSEGSTFFSTNDTTIYTSGDVLETKAIAEYERDRKRAHKGHDNKKKVIAHRSAVESERRAPGWKRPVGDDRERRILSRIGRNLRLDREETDLWNEDRESITAEEVVDKENRPSAQSLVLGLEELALRSQPIKGGRNHTRSSTAHSSSTRPSSGASFDTFTTDLISPLMADTPIGNQTFEDQDDGNGSFEFFSPGAADWTIAATEDGCLTYSACGTVSSPSSSTTVVVMPCGW